MSDDISFCLESNKCKRYKCSRHASNIIEKWRDHSFMSLKDTAFCERQKKRRNNERASNLSV